MGVNTRSKNKKSNDSTLITASNKTRSTSNVKVVKKPLAKPTKSKSKSKSKSKAIVVEADEEELEDNPEGIPTVKTAGIVPFIYSCLTESVLVGSTSCAALCSEAVNHVAVMVQDIGWGCGYNNGQMLFSSLVKMKEYSTIFIPDEDRPDITFPTFKMLRRLIHLGWQSGFDTEGKKHFDGVLGKKWIGPSEIWTMFVSRGIRLELRSFSINMEADRKTTPIHTALVRWVFAYYGLPLMVGELTYGGVVNSIISTSKQPIMLQGGNHSRTVIGVEVDSVGELYFIVLDPSQTREVIKKFLAKSIPAIFRNGRLVTQPGGREPKVTNRVEVEVLLSRYKISILDLNKDDSYQVAYVLEGTRMTDEERGKRMRPIYQFSRSGDEGVGGGERGEGIEMNEF